MPDADAVKADAGQTDEEVGADVEDHMQLPDPGENDGLEDGEHDDDLEEHDDELEADIQEALFSDAEERTEAQVQLLVQATNTNPFFSTMSDALHSKFCSHMSFEGFLEGDLIYEEGDEDDCFYVVRDGSIGTTMMGEAKGDLTRGEIFGQESVYEKMPRVVTATAKEDCVLWKIEGSAFDEMMDLIMAKGPEERSESDIELLFEATRTNNFFLTRCKPWQHTALCKFLKRSTFALDEQICEQGQAGDTFFIIRHGSVRILIDNEEVAVKHRGSSFGEDCIFDKPRSATCVSNEAATRCFVLQADHYHTVQSNAAVMNVMPKIMTKAARAKANVFNGVEDAELQRMRGVTKKRLDGRALMLMNEDKLSVLLNAMSVEHVQGEELKTFAIDALDNEKDVSSRFSLSSSSKGRYSLCSSHPKATIKDMSIDELRAVVEDIAVSDLSRREKLDGLLEEMLVDDEQKEQVLAAVAAKLEAELEKMEQSQLRKALQDMGKDGLTDAYSQEETLVHTKTGLTDLLARTDASSLEKVNEYLTSKDETSVNFSEVAAILLKGQSNVQAKEKKLAETLAEAVKTAPTKGVRGLLNAMGMHEHSVDHLRVQAGKGVASGKVDVMSETQMRELLSALSLPSGLGGPAEEKEKQNMATSGNTMDIGAALTIGFKLKRRANNAKSEVKIQNADNELLRVLGTHGNNRSEQDIDMLVKTTKNNPFFKGFPTNLHRDFCRHMAYKEYDAGHTIFKRGDEGASCYIIRQGTIETLRENDAGEEIVVVELHRGDSFGVESVVQKIPRLGTVRTKTDTVCWVIQGSVYDAMMLSIMSKPSHSRSTADLRLLMDATRGRLGFFANLTPDFHLAMVKDMQLETHAVSKWVYKQGDSGNNLYIIRSGAIELTYRAKPQLDRTSGPGQTFGEEGVLEATWRVCSAQCVTPTGCVLWRINSEEYDRQLSKILRIHPADRSEAVVSILCSATETNDFFRKMPGEMHRDFCRSMDCETFNTGDVVFQQGDPGTSVYVVRSGVVGVTKNGKTKPTVRRGGTVGEESVIQDTDRLVKAVANAHTVLWRVQKVEFDRLINETLLKPVDDRTDNDVNCVFTATKSNAFFEAIHPLQHLACCKYMTLKTFEDNEVMFNEGDEGTAFYIVRSGSVSVRQGGEEKAVLERGASLGEDALVKGVPRNATCVAVRFAKSARGDEPDSGQENASDTFDASFDAKLTQSEVVRRKPASRTFALSCWVLYAKDYLLVLAETHKEVKRVKIMDKEIAVRRRKAMEEARAIALEKHRRNLAPEHPQRDPKHLRQVDQPSAVGGNIFSCGQGCHRQLGQRQQLVCSRCGVALPLSKDMRTCPKCNGQLEISYDRFQPSVIGPNHNQAYGAKITAITSGAMHSLALTKDGKCYAWGTGPLGQLGTAQPMPAFGKDSVGDPVDVNGNESQFVDYHGWRYEIEWLGRPSRGLVALGRSLQAAKKAKKAVSIAAAKKASKDGKALMAALADLDKEDDSVDTTTLVITVESVDPVVGGLVVLSDRSCFENPFPQFEASDQEAAVRFSPRLDEPFPTLIRRLCSKVVVQVACGRAHSLALDDAGDMWSWGSGIHGQLGRVDTFGHHKNSKVPHRLDYFHPPAMDPFAVGAARRRSMLAVEAESDDSDDYVSGNMMGGRGHNVGEADGFEAPLVEDESMRNHRKKAKKMAMLHGPKMGGNRIEILGISAGQYHSACVANGSNDCYVWGQTAFGQVGNGQTTPNRNLPCKTMAFRGEMMSMEVMDEQEIMERSRMSAVQSIQAEQAGRKGNAFHTDKMDVNRVLGGSAVKLRKKQRNAHHHQQRLKQHEMEDRDARASEAKKRISILEGCRRTAQSAEEQEKLTLEIDREKESDDLMQIDEDKEVDAMAQLRDMVQAEGDGNAADDLVGSVDIGTVTCGWNHVVALDTQKNVYAWGHNGSGQLGLGMLGAYVSWPTRLKYFDCLKTETHGKTEDDTVLKIAAGWSHTLVCTTQGKVYSFGSPKNGQLGILAMNGNKPAVHGTINASRFRYPCRVFENLSSHVVVNVACGMGHSMAITDRGIVFAWGRNNQGQLGLGDATDASFPKKAIGMSGHPAIAIATCWNHTFIATGARGGDGDQDRGDDSGMCTVS